MLTRAAPALNIFAIGFPVTMIVGFAALMLALPYVVPALEQLFEAGIGTMLQLAR